jgi:hypothetical protein
MPKVDFRMLDLENEDLNPNSKNLKVFEKREKFNNKKGGTNERKEDGSKRDSRRE